jgi:hypothetical protein
MRRRKVDFHPIANNTLPLLALSADASKSLFDLDGGEALSVYKLFVWRVKKITLREILKESGIIFRAAAEAEITY